MLRSEKDLRSSSNGAISGRRQLHRGGVAGHVENRLPLIAKDFGWPADIAQIRFWRRQTKLQLFGLELEKKLVEASNPATEQPSHAHSRYSGGIKSSIDRTVCLAKAGKTADENRTHDNTHWTLIEPGTEAFLLSFREAKAAFLDLEVPEPLQTGQLSQSSQWKFSTHSSSSGFRRWGNV